MKIMKEMFTSSPAYYPDWEVVIEKDEVIMLDKDNMRLSIWNNGKISFVSMLDDYELVYSGPCTVNLFDEMLEIIKTKSC